MIKPVLLYAAIVLSAVSCAKPEPPVAAGPAASRPVAEATPQNSPEVAHSSPLITQALTRSVDYEELKALLPDVDGWTRTNTRSEQLSMPVIYSRAETRYRKDDGHVELDITDSAMNAVLLAPVAMFVVPGFSERSDDGFKKSVKIGNHPGVEIWNGRSRRGEVTAIVNNRFIVHAIGHDIETIDPARRMVEAVDLGRLASLK